MVLKQPIRVRGEKRRLHVENIDPTVLSRLRSTPWCARLLADPSFTPITAEARSPKPFNEDTLIAETFRTPETIHTWQYFYRANALAEADPEAPWAELDLVVGCGSGLNGHPGILHGGMFSFILDEVVSTLAGLHRPEGMSGMTGSLAVDYKKPVSTPGMILAKAFLLPESSGRKARVRGSLEDGNGTVHASATALIIEVPADRFKI